MAHEDWRFDTGYRYGEDAGFWEETKLRLTTWMDVAKLGTRKGTRGALYGYAKDAIVITRSVECRIQIRR